MPQSSSADGPDLPLPLEVSSVTRVLWMHTSRDDREITPRDAQARERLHRILPGRERGGGWGNVGWCRLAACNDPSSRADGCVQLSKGMRPAVFLPWYPARRVAIGPARIGLLEVVASSNEARDPRFRVLSMPLPIPGMKTRPWHAVSRGILLVSLFQLPDCATAAPEPRGK